MTRVLPWVSKQGVEKYSKNAQHTKHTQTSKNITSYKNAKKETQKLNLNLELFVGVCVHIIVHRTVPIIFCLIFETIITALTSLTQPLPDNRGEWLQVVTDQPAAVSINCLRRRCWLTVCPLRQCRVFVTLVSTIYVDGDLLMRTYVKRAVSCCFAALRQLRQIRRSVPTATFPDAGSCTGSFSSGLRQRRAGRHSRLGLLSAAATVGPERGSTDDLPP